MIQLLAALILAAPLAPAPLTPADARLIAEGRRWRVQSLTTGRLHPHLEAAAQRHAGYQAAVQIQGHQGWNARMAELQRLMPDCREFQEVANESWPGQDIQAAAYEMYRSWKLSEGHWSAVNGHCRYYGYAMRLSKNGTWYACGIFAR
jgi:hypothetical protein